MLDHLSPIREKLLLHANLSDGQTLLDVGCGDGLIGFGALQNTPCRVVFSDISQDLLEHTQTIAKDSGWIDRCEFVEASAENLRAIGDESVDTVAVRSVLIYVTDKQSALNAFHRVLKVEGKLAIFEPVNGFRYPEPFGTFGGISVAPVADIAEKVKSVYLRLQTPKDDPLFTDERQLLDFAEQAGFKRIHVEFHAEIKPFAEMTDWNSDWETLMRVAPNPRAPTFEDAMQEALTPTEMTALVSHMRPLYEQRCGTCAHAFTYLFATK